MEQSRIDRINELARLAKERSLTTEETEERQRLRQEYVQAFRRNLMATLDNVYIQEPDGSVHKLQKKDEK